MGDGREIGPVGIVLHPGREGAVDAGRSLLRWLADRGVRTRSLSGELEGADESAPPEAFAADLALVVSVGGDGTLLRAAYLANRAGVPVLGVNVGRLGFLTEAAPADAPALLSDVLDGSMVIEERMAIMAHPIGAQWEPQWALNEVIMEKVARHHLIRITALVDGEPVTTFSADGVIVATPTGSTAYSFSARGPVVSPNVECLLLTPVSPHMLFDRSLVLPADQGVTLEVVGDEPGLLSADGRPGLELPIGSSVRIQRADRPARLVRRRESAGFLSLLREKFSLPGEAPHGTSSIVGAVGGAAPGDVGPDG